MIHNISQVVWTPEMGSLGTMDTLFMISVLVNTILQVGVAFCALFVIFSRYRKAVALVGFGLAGISMLVMAGTGFADKLMRADQKNYYDDSDWRYGASTWFYSHMVTMGFILVALASVAAVLIAKSRSAARLNHEM